MDKSQLRRLALDFSQGNVDHDAYVRERTELIDNIVSGGIVITREEPEPRPNLARPTVEPDPTPTIRLETPARRLSPVHIVVGGALIAAVVAVFLVTGDEEPATPRPRPTVSTVPPPSSPSQPAARVLVDEFLDNNEWGATGLANFRGAWQALDDRQRAEALSAPWFRTLTTALKQEINAQRALAGLDGGTGARVEGRRLVKFARSLGISGPFPSFADPGRADTTSASAATPAGADRDKPDAEPASSGGSLAPPGGASTDGTTDTGARAAAGANAPAAERGNGQAPDDPSWLGGLDDGAITVQLFAVNRLDEVDRLMAAHPDLSLKVVRSAQETAPRFRVVKGPYSDASSARAWYAELPDSLKNGRDSPVLRTAAELRALIAPGAGAAGSSGSALASVPATSSSGAGGAERYTLQLFASDKRDNVERMMADYPQLGLRLHTGAGPGAPYRVLFGDFATPEAASAAGAALPEGLIASTGTPLIKIGSDPDGATIPPPQP